MTSALRDYRFGLIGVIAKPSDRPAVREFFELLKTQWDFYRAGCQYDVVLVADASASAEAFKAAAQSARLVVIYGSDLTAFDYESARLPARVRSNVTVSAQGQRIPIYGCCASILPPGAIVDVLSDDLREPVASVTRADGRTIIRVGYDLFAEVRHLLTSGQPASHAAIPTLERHIALLRRWILASGIPFVEVPPVPEGYNFSVCLTHDVDHPSIRLHRFDHTMVGFVYRALFGSLIDMSRGRTSISVLRRNVAAALSLPFVHLGWAEDFWSNLERYVDIDKASGSTFFFIPTKHEPGRLTSGTAPRMRASAYDVGDVGDTARSLAAKGCEIGVHGIDAWLDAASGADERERVSRAVGAPVTGVRMHWLYFDENAPSRLEEAGFAYDSTCGYNDAVGFRAGTLQAFKPINARRLLELPLHIMDTALFYPSHLHLTAEAATGVVAPLIEEAERHGGALTINWHDRSLAPERLWDTFYLDLLEDLRRRAAWFPSASQMVSWFRRRRSVRFESIRTDGNAMRVAASLDVAEHGPALVLRVHRPWRADAGMAHAPWPPGEPSRPTFTDVAFKDTVDARVEV